MAIPATLFPFVTAGSVLLLEVVAYAVATALGHVNPIWPYTSDLGVLAPEGSVTSFLLIIAAITGFPLAFIRHKFFSYFEIYQLQRRLRHLAKANLVFMCLNMFGVVLVGSFQEFGPDKLHSVGSVLLFVFGSLGCIVDSYITCQMKEETCGRRIKYTRVFAAVVLPVVGILCFIAKTISESQLRNAYPDKSAEEIKDLKLKWNSTTPVYPLHLVGSVSELLVLFIYFVYISSFVYEFKGLSVELKLIDE